MQAPGSDSDSHPAYRPEIDGLRAVAVLAVVAFHAFPTYAAGGLVGVDIFFVISGFLISSIIIRGLQRGRFSYLDFYVRRVRRIFPALLLVLLCCLVAGWFTLYDREFAPLGKHIAGGAGFVANFVLWQETGYFDTQAQFKQLLHLWSLGIEEQYYLLWPLFLALMWRASHRLLPLIAGLLLASFALNVYMVEDHLRETFYFPVTRFWELMIGSLLAYASLGSGPLARGTAALANDRRIAEPLAWTGLLLLGIAMAITSDRSLFPGWYALLPTLGAAALIAAGPANTVSRLLLTTKPMVFVGLISYPLYLWHWPVLSFARIYSSDVPSRGLRFGLVLLSLLLAWLTYQFCEKPVRNSRQPRTVWLLLLGMALLGGAGLAVYGGDGVPSRGVNDRKATELALLRTAERSETELRTVTYRPDSCSGMGFEAVVERFCERYGRADGPTIVLWGDSHAWAWAPVFYKMAGERGWQVVRFSIGGCPPLLTARRAGSEGAVTSCYDFGLGRKFVAAIGSLQPRHVYWIGYWSLYAPEGTIATPEDANGGVDALGQQLQQTLAALPQVPVTLFRTSPLLLNNQARGLLRGVKIAPTVAEHRAREAGADQAIGGLSAADGRLVVFDPAVLACREVCGAVQDGTLMFFDAGHVSAQGALRYESQLSADFTR